MSKLNALIIKELPSINWSRSSLGAAVIAVYSGLFTISGPALAQSGSLAAGPGFEDTVENAVEQRVEEEVEQGISEAVNDSVQAAVEDQVAEQVEDRFGDLVAGPGFFLDKIEAGLEARLEEEVAETLEDEVEDAVVAIIEKNVEEDVQDSIEDTIEESIEESVEESIADSVEEAIVASVEDSVEESIQEDVLAAVDDSVEESVEGSVTASVEESVESSVAAAVEDSLESEVAASVEENLEQTVEGDIETQVADAVEDRIESEIIEQIESGLEIDEGRIRKGQWLVMAEPEVFEQLAEEGYLFDAVTDLPGMGLRLAEVAAPSSFDISDVRQGVVDVVGSDRAEVDLNHFYMAGTPEPHHDSNDGVPPRAAMAYPEDMTELSLRIGMIDSKVDTTHPALSGDRIHSQSFVSEGAEMPDFHGTAIASIIAADSPDYLGLAPNAEVYAAAVFEQDDERGEIASTVSLVRALDWLITSGVDVVNVSLAGPPNRLLEAALKRAKQQDVIILAAAGNGGPAAKPMYPAAYDTVVAVTAVDVGGQVFRLANRGSYLDLSAPGVGLMHALAGGGYAASSGTSFAVPFAATAAARIKYLQPEDNVLDLLIRSATDLGPPGRDEIYGYGLLSLAAVGS
jgi:hypothetical protein